LDAGQTEVADLEIAVLVDEDIAGLKIAMDDTCGVDIFKTPLSRSQLRRRERKYALGTDQDLVEKVLLLQRP
jgi:hypothetical protein